MSAAVRTRAPAGWWAALKFRFIPLQDDGPDAGTELDTAAVFSIDSEDDDDGNSIGFVGNGNGSSGRTSGWQKIQAAEDSKTTTGVETGGVDVAEGDPAASPRDNAGEGTALLRGGGAAAPAGSTSVSASTSSLAISDVSTTERTSISETVINLFRSFIGSGALGIPYAFAQGGFVFSVAMLLLFSVLSFHCTMLLLACRRDMKSYGTQVTFGDVGYYAMGAAGRNAINLMLAFTQAGFCAAYVILVGSTMHQLVETVDVRSWYLFLVWPVFLALSMLRTLKRMAPASQFANVALAAAFACLYYYAVQRLASVGVHSDVVAMNTSKCYLSIGAFAYSFEGIGMSLPIRESMREPRRFPSVLAACYLVFTLLFISLGLLSYLSYGPYVDETSGTQEVAIANLPASFVLVLVRLAVAVAITLTYPLQVFPVFQIVELGVFKGAASTTPLRVNVLRAILCSAIVMCAVVVPHFGLVLALVGAMGCSAMAFVLPTLFYHRVFLDRLVPGEASKNIAIVVCGVVVAIVCTVLTLRQIITCISDPAADGC